MVYNLNKDTLLREKNVEAFKRNPTYYQELRSIVSAGANGLNEVVDVGTTCARDPAVVNGFKVNFFKCLFYLFAYICIYFYIFRPINLNFQYMYIYIFFFKISFSSSHLIK
jgi:hypothetical protein